MTVLQPFIDGPIAHRTLHDVSDGRPENSWEGLDAAISAGVAIEVDLQLSRDGVPMVFHDYELDRLTERKGLVADYDADELEKMILKGGTRGIPRFDDFMAYVAGQVPVLVEMKDQDGALGEKLTAMEAETCAVLRNYIGAVAIMSFNPNMMARCAMLAPDIPRGLVTDPFLEQDWPNVPKDRRQEYAAIPHYGVIGVTFISHNRADLLAEPVAKLKQSGATIFCWTVRSAEQEKQARKVADSITFEGYLPMGIG
jgi:glycerophosphoryl diester phosphodiesterase